MKNKFLLPLPLILSLTSCITTAPSVPDSHSPLNKSIIKNMKQTVTGLVYAKFVNECTLKTISIMSYGSQEIIYEVNFSGIATDRIRNNDFYDSIDIVDTSDADPKSIHFSIFWLNQINSKTKKLSKRFVASPRKETTMTSWSSDGPKSFSKRQQIVDDLKKLAVKCGAS